MESTTKLEKAAMHLVIDIGSPMDSYSLDNLIQACQNVFALLCSIRDQSYNRLVSIGVINQRYQKVLQPTQTFGNYCRISKALLEAQSSAQTNVTMDCEEFKDYLNIGLKSVTDDLRTSKLGLSDEFYDINLCLITLKSAEDIKQYLNDLIEEKSNPHLKINTVIQICKYLDSQNEDLNKFYKINNSIPEIEFCLKKWLLYKKFSREQIRLVLPDNTTILCDLEENIISPKSLIFGHKFHINQEAVECKTGQELSVDKTYEINIYKIQIIHRIPSSGLCETQTFGEAFNIIPTSYHQEGYEDAYSINCQNFQCLCLSLAKKEEYLIAKMEDQDPTGFFVLIPSYSSLLIKSLVCQELVIPENQKSSLIPCSTILKERMENSIKLIDVIDEYDPDKNNSGIYSLLKQTLKAKKIKEEDTEESASWVKVSHPALDKNTQAKPQKKKRPNFEPMRYIQYIDKKKKN